MALITLQQAKDYLQITSTASNTVLTLYIDMVSAEIGAYCGRVLDQSYYTGEVLEYEYSKLDGTEENFIDKRSYYTTISLKNYPVTTASVAITENGIAVPTADYHVDAKSGVITWFGTPSDNKKKLIASYTAGYTTASGQTFTVPFDLYKVAAEGVRYMFVNGGTATENSGNITSKKVKDFSVSYGANSDTSRYMTLSSGAVVPTYIGANATILDRYKSVISAAV